MLRRPFITRLVLGLGLLSSATISHAQTTKLTVTIDRVVGVDDMDWWPVEGAEFYATVTFDGAIYSNIRNTAKWYGRDDISPEWSFTVDESMPSIPVTVEIWDEDGPFNLPDDQLDIDPNPANGVSGRRLDFTVDVQDCINQTGGLSGDLTGDCGTTLVSNGAEAGVRGSISLTVTAESPPAAPGLRVRCLHDPIWAQPGDDVTITAVAVDDGPLNKGTLTADQIAIEVGGTVHTCNNTQSCSAVEHSVTAGTLDYACSAQLGSSTVSTGSRSTRVGPPPNGTAVDILTTGSSSSRLDQVFIASSSDYPSATDPAFLADVTTLIEDGYYDWDVHLKNQDGLNFWIAIDQGDFPSFCDIVAPPDWFRNFAFADIGSILHTSGARDCANPGRRLHSVDASSAIAPNILMHEAGHAPFGLVDEYDGPLVPYWEPADLPNVYSSLTNCENDVPNLLHWEPTRTTADCREIGTRGWFTSDPPSNDLMVDNTEPQAADLRRIEWIYGKCKESTCIDMAP